MKEAVDVYKRQMLRGMMDVLTDSASKEMIWQEGDTMYYPEGVTDPDYCVSVSYTHLDVYKRQHILHHAGIQVCAGAVGNPSAKAVLNDLRNALLPDIYLFIRCV